MANPIYGGRVQTKQDWDFRIGLFECLNDKNLCLLGCFCPCYIGGMNKSEADGRPNHFCDCLCWLPSVEYYTRIQLRRKYDVLLNVEVEWLQWAPDVLVILACLPCAVCQHSAEIKEREHPSRV